MATDKSIVKKTANYGNGLLPMPPFPWQSNIWLEFVERIKRDRMPHAVLLYGEQGIGALELSQALAQYASCFSPTDSIACGKCKACTLMNAGSYPDLLSIGLEEKAKQIKVDQIRAVSNFVSKTSQLGGKKVIIIEAAETMNVNAANALLKNLEEPSGDTLFVLTSNQIGRILPTIRSRCFQISVPYPKKHEAMAWLDTQSIEDAENLLDYARGAPVLALEWFNTDAISDRKSVFNGMTYIVMGQQSSLYIAQQWGQLEPLNVLDAMQYAIDECIKGAMLNAEAPQAIATLLRSVAGFPASVFFKLRDKLLLKRGQLEANTNLNPALFVEELALDWAALSEYGRRSLSRSQ